MDWGHDSADGFSPRGPEIPHYESAATGHSRNATGALRGIHGGRQWADAAAWNRRAAQVEFRPERMIAQSASVNVLNWWGKV